MSSGPLVLTLVAVLGCGLVARVFFAFSTFVMPALRRLPAPDGVAAIQQINIKAINPWFMGAFSLPRNDALAKLAHSSDQAADTWKRYLAEWTAWNHVRKMASFATTAALIIAIAGT